MLLAASIVIVFGLAALLVTAAGAPDPGASLLPVEWLIHRRTPVALLGLLGAGVALGVTSTVRRPRWFKFPALAAELAVAGVVAFYFTSMSFLPEHSLGVATGDAFPAYTLVDQDGVERSHPAAGGGKRALYIFYRGDW